MATKFVQYKDTIVATNTELYAAIESGEDEKASKLYKALMDDFYEANPCWRPFPEVRRTKVLDPSKCKGKPLSQEALLDYCIKLEARLYVKY